MKKILIFSLAYYPRVGGAEVAIKEITDRIGDVEFHLVTMRFSAADLPQEHIGSMTVHRVGNGASYLSKILFVPRAALMARRLHAQEKFDAAWAMMSYMLLPLLLARLNIPYALTLQEGDTEAHMFGRLRILPFLWLLNRGFREATVVQTISTYLGGWARARGFAGPLEIIPNGVDIKKFAGENAPHAGDVLVTSSRLVRKNAIDIILRALPLLPQEVRLIVAGSGPDEKKLKALARELGVAERVEWLGYVDHGALPALLHRSNVFVRPSRSEGMGNSFVEAMAAGLPVIATQEGGLKDFITSEVAWPVPKNSPEALAAAVKEILGNPAHAAQVITRAKQLAFENYDWELVARQMRERVFSRVLS